MSLHSSADLLLIDDSEDDVFLAREALAGTRLRLVGVAEDGEQGLALLRAYVQRGALERPLLTWLDLNLPGRSGLEILEEIRTDAVLRRLPIIILTVSNNPEDVAKAYACGASSYVRKPADLDEFRDTVRALEKYWLDVAILPAPGILT